MMFTRTIDADAARCFHAKRLLPVLLLGAGAALMPLTCPAADPQPGGGHATQAQGSAAGGTSSEANSQLESCNETLGTISIDEQTNAGWYAAYQSQYKMGSTVPALRLIIQQSNCFVIVDRGRGLAARNREADLIRGEEGRAGSNYGKGQIAAADYTMIPEVILSDRGGQRAGGGLGWSAGPHRSRGGRRRHRRRDVDQRGGSDPDADRQPLHSSARGRGGLFEKRRLRRDGRHLRRRGGWRRGAYTSTPQGKVIFAAFTDSYNKMVRALRNYKAQTVRGGLGTGGRLGVQGGSTDASREVDSKPKQ